MDELLARCRLQSVFSGEMGLPQTEPSGTTADTIPNNPNIFDVVILFDFY